MTKLFYYFIQSIFIYIFFFLGRLLGLKLSRKIFSIVFNIAGRRFKSKKIINKNLSIFSKNLSTIDRDFIIESMWKNYGMTFIEYVFLKKFRKENSHINIVGEKILEKIIEKNKPVIFVSGHFANFELMSMEITKKNIKLATIYRPLNNIFLNPFMEYLRKKYVCKNQIKKGLKGVKDTMGYINKNHSIALMIDQRVSEGEKINFFNEKAFTTTLPAQLALKFNMSIIPVFIQRERNNTFKLEFQNEINSENFRDKTHLTEYLNKVLEKMILKNPNQWIWTHNRWK